MFDFLTLKPQAFGLDISDLSIKVARLKKRGGRYRLASFGEFPLQQGIIENGEIKKEEALVDILGNLQKHTKGTRLDTAYVIASLPEEKAFLQVIQLPLMKKEELKQAVLVEAENYIPYSVETVYIDYALLPLAPNNSNHLDVLLASLPREIVDSYVAALRKARLIPLAFEIESLAIARALIKKETIPYPYLLIDVGATRASFSVFAGSSLKFTSSIPISAVQFTRAIAKSFAVDEKEAEEIKKRYGLSAKDHPDGKRVFDALVPVLTDLVEQMEKYIDYYESHAKNGYSSVKEGKIKKVLLCGGGAVLRGFPEFLSQQLRIDVELGNPWANILPEVTREVPQIPYEESLRYVTALGLAIRGVQSSRE